MATSRLLIIEDEKLISMSLSAELRSHGYEVDEAATGRDGLARFGEAAYDLVLLDYRLPDIDGIQVLRELMRVSPDTPVILMTAYSTIETAVEAIKLGAFDYVNKPFDEDELLIRIAKALETTTLRREVKRFTRAQQQEHGLVRLIGASPAMQALRAQLGPVIAAGNATVLLRGESGTGKDVLARIVHYESARARAPFVNITCTAIPDHLLESELFGHERGAFTDARQQKRGLLEQADGGTVFLDEIGDMSVALQAKLLRFLEERCFRRIGGSRDIAVDVRVIAATNRDLEEAVRRGAFRPDLYYRLKVVELHTPPLRARQGDVVLLAQAFVERFARELRREPPVLSPEVVAALERYPWPGNVRELRNAVERALILGQRSVLSLWDLPPEVAGSARAARPAAAIDGGAAPPEPSGPAAAPLPDRADLLAGEVPGVPPLGGSPWAALGAEDAALRGHGGEADSARGGAHAPPAGDPPAPSGFGVAPAWPSRGGAPGASGPLPGAPVTPRPAAAAPPAPAPAAAPAAAPYAAPLPGPRRGLYFDLPPGGIDWTQLEEDLVRQALALTASNQSRAARLLGLSRDQLRYRMERMGLLKGTRRGKREGDGGEGEVESDEDGESERAADVRAARS